jgi:glycosyltransferase involved in cell wall biosynthesis
MYNSNDWTLKKSLEIKTYLKDVKDVDPKDKTKTNEIPKRSKDELVEAQSKFFKQWGLNIGDGKIHVLMIAGDFGGCGFVRCESVAKYLNREQDIVAFPTCMVVPELLNWANVIVWQRQYKEIFDKVRDTSKKFNRYQIYEIDDNLHAVPENNPAYHTYNQNRPESGRILEWMKECDFLTVSREPLGAFYKNITGKDYFTLENCIDFELYKKPVFKKDNKQIRIGWVGSSTHYDDLKVAAYGISQIVEEYGDRVKFVMMGWDGIMRRQNKDGDLLTMGDSLDGIPREFHKFVDIHDYPNRLHGLNLDIAIAPLVDNEFNRGKSNIKWMEYSACGVPVIVSKVSAYTDYVVPGETALIAKREGDWYKKVKFMIENEEKRIEIAEKAYNEVRNKFSFSTNIDQWANLYRKLLTKKLKYGKRK